MSGPKRDNTMTLEELLSLPVSVPVVDAGRAFGLSRDGVYDLLRRNEFPCRTIKVGRTTRVPRAELLRVLGVIDDIPIMARTTARLLQQLLSSSNEVQAAEALVNVYPWLEFLPADGQTKFVREYARTLNACAEIDVWAPLARVIREWKATAAIHADPTLHAILTDPAP